MRLKVDVGQKCVSGWMRSTVKGLFLVCCAVGLVAWRKAPRPVPNLHITARLPDSTKGGAGPSSSGSRRPRPLQGALSRGAHHGAHQLRQPLRGLGAQSQQGLLTGDSWVRSESQGRITKTLVTFTPQLG